MCVLPSDVLRMFCSGVDEVGLMIGEFDNARVDRRFDGYTDKSATDKKVCGRIC
jgi:hypothetical protein